MNVISNNKVCIEEDGICYTLARMDEYETNNSFNKRIQFIKKNKPMTEADFKKLITYSHIYSNIELLGCSYPPKIEKELNSYIK